MSAIRKFTNTEAAYLAGIFDGEGSLFFYKRHVEFCITQGAKGLPMLEEAQRIIGRGHLYVHRKAIGKWQTVYRLRVQSTKYAQAIVSQLVPYLIVKRELAERLLSL